MNSIASAGSAQLQQIMAVAAQIMSQNTQELAASLIHLTLDEMGRMAQAAAQANGKGLHLDIMV